MDSTIVNTCAHWWDYLKYNSRSKPMYNTEQDYIDVHGVLPYDYSNCFDISKKVAHQFWYRSDLYDSLSPIDGAVDVLKKLHDEHGLSIVFCSHVCGGHYDTKVNFLNKYFPFNDGILITGQKNLATRSLFAIDDRNSYLNMIDSEHHILMYTPVEQEVELTVHTDIAKNWDNVLKITEKYLGSLV